MLQPAAVLIGKPKREKRIGLHRKTLGFVCLLPEEFATYSRGLDTRHIHLMASDLATLTPGLKGYRITGFSARHFDHEVHSGDHEAVTQKAQLHVLAAKSGAGVVLFAVAFDFVEHLWVPSSTRKQ